MSYHRAKAVVLSQCETLKKSVFSFVKRRILRLIEKHRNKSRIFKKGEKDYIDGNPVLRSLDRSTFRMNFSDYLSWYNIHRGYLEHEDNLINYRVGWALSIHGFLYAAYALVLTTQIKSLTSDKPMLSTHIHSFRYVRLFSHQQHIAKCGLIFQSEMYLLGITVIGIVIILSGLLGALLAQRAMKNVARSFRIQNRVRVLYRSRKFDGQEEGIPHYKFTKRPIRYLIGNRLFLPGITGGGSKLVSKWGSFSSVLIPFILAAGWLISLVVLYRASSGNLQFACGHNFWHSL